MKEALGFLMTREIAHQQSFEKALYAIQPNFPPGKLPGMPEFTNVYFNMSKGSENLRGPWNNEPVFEFRDAEPGVDGGSGVAELTLRSDEKQVLDRMAARTRSDPQSAPTTGAELGMAAADGGTMPQGAGNGAGMSPTSTPGSTGSGSRA